MSFGQLCLHWSRLGAAVTAAVVVVVAVVSVVVAVVAVVGVVSAGIIREIRLFTAASAARRSFISDVIQLSTNRRRRRRRSLDDDAGPASQITLESKYRLIVKTNRSS